MSKKLQNSNFLKVRNKKIAYRGCPSLFWKTLKFYWLKVKSAILLFGGNCGLSIRFSWQPAHKTSSLTNLDHPEIPCKPKEKDLERKNRRKMKFFWKLQNSSWQNILRPLWVSVGWLLTFKAIFGHFEPSSSIFLGIFL